MLRRALFLLTFALAAATATAFAQEGATGSSAARIAHFLTENPRQHRQGMISDPLLTRVAMERARDMAAGGYFSHVNRQGEGVNYLVARAGYPLPAWLLGSRSLNTLESICAGYSTPERAWETWMKSRPHRTHLLGLRGFYAAQNRYGIGVAYDPASPMKYYYVVITAPPPSLAAAENVRGHRAVTPWFGAMR